MKFEAYSIAPEIKSNLERMGFKRPTDIQFKSIPAILKGEDVLAIAQTGTGKTAAFAIPVIHKLHVTRKLHRSESVRCLIMVPTRELAMQIAGVFEQLAKGTRVKVFSLFGGVEQDPQIARLTAGVDILVSTPGRLFDLVSQGHLQLNQVQILILDEADHMLDLGFIKDIRDLLRFLPRKRQTLFFSATINETIKKLAYSLVHNPIRIQISPKNPVARNINHAVAFIAMDDKRFFLERLIHENPESKILVFVRTKVRAERVCKAMERVSIESAVIHGGKDQADRQAVLKRFRTGDLKLLIATDVSARGIDIPDVDLVVNYDLPDQAENYVHRVGRTGRGTRKGRAVAFCSPEEKPLLEAIESLIDQPVTVLEIDPQAYTETLDLSTEMKQYDWKGLLEEVENLEKRKKKSKKT